MPTYEYRCSNGHEFEIFQKMSDDPVASCPECGAEAERVLSGGAGFLFKGEGFYITDYRSEEYRKAAAAEKGGDSGGKKSEKGKEGGESGAGMSKKTSGKDAPAGGSGGGGAGSSGSGGGSSTSKGEG